MADDSELQVGLCVRATARWVKLVPFGGLARHGGCVGKATALSKTRAAGIFLCARQGYVKLIQVWHVPGRAVTLIHSRGC
jgi:hypothetical protein